MSELGSDDLRRSVEVVAGALEPYVDADWSPNAGDLTWTCRATFEHIIDCNLWYAGNLAMLATEGRQDVRDGDPNGDIPRLLNALVSSGYILARVVEATPPGGRGYHGLGPADASGFAAMGCDETLVHGYDVCKGLGFDFRPPDEIVMKLLARLFPWAPDHDDPWEALLWCNGRIALPGRERLTKDWGWWCRPLADWDGVAYTDHEPR